MEIENLLDKKGTAIYKNGEALGGVIYFAMKTILSTKAENGGEGLYEILSGNPWQILKDTESYVITIKQYATEFIDFGTDSFTLKIKNGENIKSFEGCVIQSQETYVDDLDKLITVSVINAERVS